MLELFEDYVADIVTQLTAAGFADGNIQAHRGMPTQDDQLPAAGVTYMGDQAKAAGDARAGIPDFVHRTVFVIDVVDRADDAPALRTKLAQHSAKVCAALLTDLTWGGETLEGIESVVHSVDLPPEGSHFLGRLQIQITTLTRTEWEPDADAANNLSTVSVSMNTGSGDVPPRTGITIPVPTI